MLSLLQLILPRFPYPYSVKTALTQVSCWLFDLDIMSDVSIWPRDIATSDLHNIGLMTVLLLFQCAAQRAVRVSAASRRAHPAKGDYPPKPCTNTTAAQCPIPTVSVPNSSTRLHRRWGKRQTSSQNFSKRWANPFADTATRIWVRSRRLRTRKRPHRVQNPATSARLVGDFFLVYSDLLSL